MFSTKLFFLLIFSTISSANGLDQMNDASNQGTRASTHPLDPLSPDEITRSKNIIVDSPEGKRTFYIFNTISLKEPPKAQLLSYFLTNTVPPHHSIARKSFSILWDSKNGRVSEAVVNLDTNTLESFVVLPENIKVPFTPDDDVLATNAVVSDARVIERCLKLGIANMSRVYTAVWPVGYIGDRPEYLALKRPYEVFLYIRNFDDDNPYAHPLPFVVIVDLVGPSVIQIENLPSHEGYDFGENQSENTIPLNPGNYDYKLRSPNFLRDDKPIHISTPEGHHYKVTGYLVEWQKFKFRIGFSPREGVFLHHVVYDDNGKIRPILYRASMAEMGVFYGDPRPPYHRKSGFDEGHLGLGLCMNELMDQEDCLGATFFLNVTFNDNRGDPVVRRNAICITEEDAGMLWKHTDHNTGKSSTVRSHRLSISSIVTTGNYDLGIRWMFYQNAAIEFNMQLTGILSTNMMAVDGTPGGFGSIVSPQVNAQYHQHLASLRFDVEVDGNSNTIEMVDIVPLDAPTGSETNRYGQGFTTQRTLLKTQSEGCTMTSPSSGRVWVVSNPSNIHPYTKKPVGWRLLPVNDAKLLMKADSPLLTPLKFLTCDVWVTKYGENQLFPGGVYLNSSGLPEWVGQDPEGSTVNRDIVLFHMWTIPHIPRAEDFPVMPVTQRSVWFEPVDFFLENPAMDVPPITGKLMRKK